MQHSRKIILIIIIIINVLLFFGVNKSSFLKTFHQPNKSIYEFELATLTVGDKFKKTDLYGQKYIINIFATWCKSCRHEHETLVDIAKENLLPIYGIAFRDNKVNLENFLKKRGNPYAKIALDNDGNFAVKAGVKGFPETFLIDEDGKVIFSHTGILTYKIYEKKIKPLL